MSTTKRHGTSTSMQIAKSMFESSTTNAFVPLLTLVPVITHFRTTCIKDDDSWHVYEENLKIDPPVEDLEKDIEVHEVIATILFSKEPIDLRNRVDEPPGEEVPSGEVEVINPMTGEVERIRTDDPSYYDVGGFKARKYKNSSKPKDILPFVWQAMSQKERRVAIAEEQRKLALEEKEKKRARRVKAVPLIGTLKSSWKSAYPTSSFQLCRFAR